MLLYFASCFWMIKYHHGITLVLCPSNCGNTIVSFVTVYMNNVYMCIWIIFESKPAWCVSLSVSLQKWQCIEDATGKLRLSKCKGMASLSAVHKPSVSSIKSQIYLQSMSADGTVNSEPQGCDCEPTSYRLSTFSKKKLFSKKSEYDQILSYKHAATSPPKTNHAGSISWIILCASAAL